MENIYINGNKKNILNLVRFKLTVLGTFLFNPTPIDQNQLKRIPIDIIKIIGINKKVYNSLIPEIAILIIII